MGQNDPANLSAKVRSRTSMAGVFGTFGGSDLRELADSNEAVWQWFRIRADWQARMSIRSCGATRLLTWHDRASHIRLASARTNQS
ncbi:hypothetical protein GCM10007858_70120 [Bradyrhizobium liaoningense]|nr:hypothetical protein GCM10007858_70120 [Bradyrhizobium liaoningense]